MGGGLGPYQRRTAVTDKLDRIEKELTEEDDDDDDDDGVLADLRMEVSRLNRWKSDMEERRERRRNLLSNILFVFGLVVIVGAIFGAFWYERIQADRRAENIVSVIVTTKDVRAKVGLFKMVVSISTPAAVKFLEDRIDKDSPEVILGYLQHVPCEGTISNSYVGVLTRYMTHKDEKVQRQVSRMLGAIAAQ